MKKIIFYLGSVTLLMILMSFNFNNKNTIETITKNDIKVISDQNDWGNWGQTSCYKGLYFRVKRGDFNSYAGKYYWYVQFRNDYSYRVDISYTMKNDGESIRSLDHGNSISAHDTYISPYFLLKSTQYVNVSVNIKGKQCDK